MHTQDQIRRYKAVKHLYQNFGSSQPWFFSADDLQGLGIRTLQVDVTSDGTLKFDPCFFRPYPERVLQKYALDLVQMAVFPGQILSPLTFRPDVTSMLQMEEETGLKNEAARATYNSPKEILGPDEWLDHAEETWSHIEHHLSCPRIGLPEGSSLFSLASLKCLR